MRGSEFEIEKIRSKRGSEFEIEKNRSKRGVGETKPNLLVCNFKIGLISICFHGNECLLFKIFRLRRAFQLMHIH